MVYVPIHDLQVNKANPRVVRDVAFKKLKESLQGAKGKEMFEARPCIVSNRTGENIIIAGNTRYKAAKELKWQEVPAVIMEGLTEEQEQEIIIRDNITNGEWDWETLANEWDAVKLEEWGVDLPEMTELETEEVVEDDYEMPDEIKTDIVLGDLFTIGEHRLLCGDATSIDAVDKLMDTQTPTIVFTDPPYGIAHTGKGIKGATQENDFGAILGDGDTQTAADAFTLYSALYLTTTLVFWGANYYSSSLPNGYGWLVWDKEREGDTFSAAEIAFVNKGVKVDVFRHQWHGMIKASEHGEKRCHPTQKPIALVVWCLENYNAGNLVLDPFLGSGSTMVAAHQLKRKCYGMELDPKYCQVIIDRMRKLDPDLVITRNGELYV